MFIRIANKIIENYYLKAALIYINNNVVKSSRKVSIAREALLGIREAVLDYILRLNTILIDIKRSGCTVSRDKSYFLS